MSDKPITVEVRELREAIEVETYYGFNLGCVLYEIARDNPIHFRVIQKAFARARDEREAIAARRIAAGTIRDTLTAADLGRVYQDRARS